MDDQDASRSLPGDKKSSSRSVLTPLKRAAQLSGRRLATVLGPPLEAGLRRMQHEFGQLLIDPKALKAVQKNLARFANLTFRLGFRADPNAALLFRFADWIEDRHGRQAVLHILLRSPLIQDPTFIDAIAYLSEIILPWSDQEQPSLSQSQLDNFKERASLKLLLLLAELAALEHKAPAPKNEIGPLIAYFEAAPIPAEFQPLAKMATGEELKTREDPTPIRWSKDLSKRLGISPKEEQNRSLRRFIPGLGDETLEFLVLSTTFFIHTYLLRHLVESLPDLAQEIAHHMQDESPIEMDKE